MFNNITKYGSKNKLFKYNKKFICNGSTNDDAFDNNNNI